MKSTRKMIALIALVTTLGLTTFATPAHAYWARGGGYYHGYYGGYRGVGYYGGWYPTYGYGYAPVYYGPAYYPYAAPYGYYGAPVVGVSLRIR